MRRILGLILICSLLAAPACAATLADGLTAYNDNRIEDARAVLTAVADDAAAKRSDRAAADRELARIAFLIDNDPALALKRLDQAQTLGDEACETGALAARILRSGGRADEAAVRGQAALSACTRQTAHDALAVEIVRDRLAAGQLELAVQAVAAISPEGRSDGEAAAVRLDLALRRQDAAGAVAAWRDYFWLSDHDGPQALAALKPLQALQNGVGSTATDAQRLAVLDILIRTGFAEAAERFAGAGGLAERNAGDPTMKKAQAYLRVRRRIDSVAVAMNRDLAHGQPKTDQRLMEEMQRDMVELAAAAGATGDPQAALLTHYNLYGTAGVTSGYPSAHIGHVVEDEKMSIEQYGRHAQMRFIVLENMLQNGFESWLWDGRAAAGGWSGDGAIVQVRPLYTRDPLRSATLLPGKPARAELMAKQSDRAAEDLAKLKTRKVAYLQGLADRLSLQNVDAIAATAAKKAGPGGDLRRAFLDEDWRAVVQHSIEKHEGRHALDNAAEPNLSTTDLEYRAKLSELALSDYPRLALWNVDFDTIEGDTPHGQADARIMLAFAQWVESHPREVANYDPATPSMVQLDKLTDAQIRTIARGLDPWAK